jgi:hypothetical protein
MRWTFGALFSAALALATVPGLALAQNCPTDLSSLSGQISTPSVQAMLGSSIDAYIAQEGSLQLAIAHTQAQLDRTKGLQSNMAATGASSSEVQRVSDLVVVLTARLNALNCRAGSSP